MSLFSKYVRWENHKGNPVIAGETTVTPESQSLILQVPYFHFSWSRPASVYVDDGQQQQRIRVMDLTRIIQLGIFAAGLITAASLWVMGRGR